MAAAIEVDLLEDASATFMARVESRPTAPGALGTPLVQADVSTIVYTVYDVTAAAAVTGHSGQSLTVSSVVFNTLQGWDTDTIGHNFRATLAGTAFPVGGNTYQVEFKFTMADGTVGFVIFNGEAEAIYTS